MATRNVSRDAGVDVPPNSRMFSTVITATPVTADATRNPDVGAGLKPPPTRFPNFTGMTTGGNRHRTSFLPQ
jgi:hypothetical protein